MNDRRSWLFALLRALAALRIHGESREISFNDYAVLIWRGFDSDFVTRDQVEKLFDLVFNALSYSELDFPDACNAGPYMPDSVWYERHQEAVKPQAVLSNESLQLQPVAARPELRLLCLLVTNRDGQARSLPVHTLRPMPPRVCSTWPNPKRGPRRWSLDAFEVATGHYAGLSLRETHAKRPTAQVLERLQRHGQAGAFRAVARTFRAGGVSHV